MLYYCRCWFMLKTKTLIFIVQLLLTVFVVTGASAQDQAIEFSGGLTAIAIATNDKRIANDQTLSIDFNIEKNTSRGRWRAYIEGNTSLDEQGASNLLVEANADSGTALDPDRSGRVQISELNYLLKRDKDQITAGLIDPSSYFDRSRITNDENVQFIGVSFVNNPTIEFPDYTIGVAMERPATGRLPAINAVVSSSNGIADNTNLSYSQLIQFSDSHKGIFSAVGLGWLSDVSTLRLGAWINTRHHASLDGSETEAINSGLYSVLGRTWQTHSLNFRIGLADRDISQGSEFLAVAYRKRINMHAIGLGVAKIFVSAEAPDSSLDDSLQFEFYGRYQFTSDFHITASVQHLKNSGFQSLPSDPRQSISLLALRLHFAY